MFVQIITGRVADREGFQRALQKWNDELRPGAAGYLGTTAGLTADGTAVLLARFTGADAARTNSERPEQGAWWSEMERCFAEPPMFEESSDIQELMGGGSDDARFVQVMRGSCADRTAVAELDALFTAAAPTWRPDVLGGVRAGTSATDCVDVTYFTSEADARAGEMKPPPAELAARAEDFQAMISGATFYDLVDPILG